MKRLPELKRMYDAVVEVNPDFRGAVNACESYGEVVRCIEAAYAALQAATPAPSNAFTLAGPVGPVTITPPAGAVRTGPNAWLMKEGLVIKFTPSKLGLAKDFGPKDEDPEER